MKSLEEIIRFLGEINKSEFSNYLYKDNLGREICDTLEIICETNKYTVLKWCFYIDNLLKLMEEIKKYFLEVNWTDFSINNFILVIK
ncbi:MAG: hypothetical protein HUJ73_02900, partial [Eubacterium sp.]|nr:hypothetical protein [Eubacterium sp.]